MPSQTNKDFKHSVSSHIFGCTSQTPYSNPVNAHTKSKYQCRWSNNKQGGRRITWIGRMKGLSFCELLATSNLTYLPLDLVPSATTTVGCCHCVLVSTPTCESAVFLSQLRVVDNVVQVQKQALLALSLDLLERVLLRAAIDVATLRKLNLLDQVLSAIAISISFIVILDLKTLGQESPHVQLLELIIHHTQN